MRQFGLLGMITKLGPVNILWKHGFYILNHHIKHSWFSQVRELALKYSLPDPVLTLTSPPLSKPAWKGTVRRAVTAYWQSKLVTEAKALPSLEFLRPAFFTLGRGTHPLWLRRHWTGESGACRLPSCNTTKGDLPAPPSLRCLPRARP